MTRGICRREGHADRLPPEHGAPFRVVFALAEPVLARYPVAFDGVLAHLAFRRSGDAARAHRGLPLAQTEGVYQASELLFLAPVVRSTVHCVRSPRWERFEHGTLGDAGAGALARVHARDRLKPTLDAYAVLSARRAYALGRGDVRAVEGLLEGLDAVGKKARSGAFGRIEAVRVEPLAEAPEFLGFTDFKGRVVRAVPRGVWRRLGLDEAGVSFAPARPRLPRWATADALCARPLSHIVPAHALDRLGL